MQTSPAMQRVDELEPARNQYLDAQKEDGEHLRDGALVRLKSVRSPVQSRFYSL